MSQILKIAQVWWVDSSSVHTDIWGDIEEACDDGIKFTEEPCISVGFVLKHTETCLVLAAPLSGEDINDSDTQCSGDMTIPCSSIQRIEYLEVDSHVGGDL